MRARLYYELHITVEASDTGFDLFKAIMSADCPTWRVSVFDQDEVDDYHGKWFMSARCVVELDIRFLLATALERLSTRGYEVLRWKAEDTLLDSKHGDTL